MSSTSRGSQLKGQKGRHRVVRPRSWRIKLAMLLFVAALVASYMEYGGRATLFGFILVYAMFNFGTSSIEARWRLYGRRDPQARQELRFPEPVRYDDAELHFYAVVAALEEAAVIGETLIGLMGQRHPNFRIVVSLVHDDYDTIAVVDDVIAEAGGRITKVLVSERKSKPYQLNAALEVINEEVRRLGINPQTVYVSPFDAEDDVAKELALHVEALIKQEGADVVQGGVQLMNLDVPAGPNASFMERRRAKFRSWFPVHNVMEYYFWFSSRMQYQVSKGFIPLGGNTVFTRLSLLNEVGGWDPDELTEDCDLGVNLSVGHNAVFAAAYSPELTTREETPSRVMGPGSLVRQRERWDQGFLSVLLKGAWLKLPTFRERVLAWYILAMPLIQAMNGLMAPLSVVAFFILFGPVPLVLVMYLPFIPIALSICLQVVGLHEFGQEYHQKVSWRHYARLLLGSYPYQLVLALAAVKAMWRYIRGHNDWRLTHHDNAHRDKSSSEDAGFEEEGSVA